MDTPWSTPPSFKVIATDRAQEEDAEPAIGRSKDAMTIKILALSDTLGNLVRFVLFLASFRSGRRRSVD
jgi:hypothetical protein